MARGSIKTKTATLGAGTPFSKGHRCSVASDAMLRYIGYAAASEQQRTSAAQVNKQTTQVTSAAVQTAEDESLAS